MAVQTETESLTKFTARLDLLSGLLVELEHLLGVVDNEVHKLVETLRTSVSLISRRVNNNHYAP
jgi:hypothetical protein